MSSDALTPEVLTAAWPSCSKEPPADDPSSPAPTETSMTVSSLTHDHAQAIPFCLAAIVMMLTHGGVPGFEPVPIADVSTAEDHLYAFGDESVERKQLLL